MTKEELIFKVNASGCKMLNKLQNMESMNMDKICNYLHNSCCPELKEISRVRLDE